MSILFIVRSRCNSEVDSGRNSARAIAPADDMDVDDRNNRFSAVLRVKAVRRDWIFIFITLRIIFCKEVRYTYAFQTRP